MEKIIELTPLAEIGRGQAKVTDNNVEIEVKGIIGGLKAWLVGKEEAQKIGNLVDGKISKQINTSNHSGILITQSGRQLLMGKYEEGVSVIPVVEKEDVPCKKEGIKWKKITKKSYAELCDELRYMLSSKAVYQNYKKYGYYWAGESEDCGALALKCEEKVNNPFAAFSDMCLYENGYVIVCVDKKTKKIKRL